MKQFTLKKKSWHFWLATELGGMYPSETEIDFCSYFWHVVKGAIGALFITAICLVVIGALLDTLYWYVTMGIALFQHQKIPMDRLGAAVTGIMLILLICLLCNVIRDVILTAKYNRMNYDNDELDRPQPGFMKLAYRKFKEKTCVQIKIQ